MRIVADRNILAIREACAGLGEVTLVTGRQMGPADLQHADALLVRSVTRVDDALLADSPVRFVGTATIGVDHLDMEALTRRDIATASAPGSNAVSVAEWLVATLLELAERTGTVLAGRTLGIIGVGHVGSAVAERTAALGLEVVLNDPPRARETGDPAFRPLDEVLERADIITLHTPLTREGEHATHHLVDEGFLERMRPGSWLVNSGRGAVVRTTALEAALDRGALACAALDVWEHEPALDRALFERLALVSPHVAGYGLDGKLAGTRMVVEALARAEGRASTPVVLPDLPVPHARIEVDVAGRATEQVLREVMRQLCPVTDQDRALREALELDETARAERFDELRRSYPVRRALEHTQITFREDPSPDLTTALQTLGLTIP